MEYNKNHNNFSDSRENPWELSEVEQTRINLEYLNGKDQDNQEQRVEQSQDISVFHIEGLNAETEHNREAVLDIYERAEMSGRDSGRQHEVVDNIVHLVDYGNFESFEGKEGFIERAENRHRAPEWLKQEISQVHNQEIHETSTSKILKFGRAAAATVGLRKVI